LPALLISSTGAMTLSHGSFPSSKQASPFLVFLVLRIRDVYPGSRILIFTHPGSRIPDPKTASKKRGEKKIFCQTFFCSHKFHKIVNYFIFEMLKKKIWANFQRILELFTQKIVTKLSKILVWDPGSGKKLIPVPGSRGQKGTGSRIRIRNTGFFSCFFF
jgi:hypothetical protein